MSEFNEINWLNALTKVYERATMDQAYRQLCLSDARVAVAQVSDVEIPADLKLSFVDRREDYTYVFLLPPALRPASSSAEQVKEIIDWSTICTNPTTITTTGG